MATILIVDDDPGVSRVLKLQLEESGHDTIVCDHGLEGFKAALGQNVDLIVTDVMMPQWNGYDLAGALEISAKPTKIIVVTGFAKDEITESLKKMTNVIAVLTKPWDRKELADLISRNV